MLLHNIGCDKFSIYHGDTLSHPLHLERHGFFDAVVSNPPFATAWEGNNNPVLVNDPRFAPPGVLAPKKQSIMAFLLHCLYYLTPNGVAGIICEPGMLYRSGAEQKIREYLIVNNYIDSIIALPNNLFFNTSIPTCIMMLKKNTLDDSVLFINATSEYVKRKKKTG